MPETDAPKVKVRIDFTVSAHALFLQCSRKGREGLLHKLKEFALHPALGKPLHAALAGYNRISYGRMRCVVRSNTKNPVVLVLAPRKEGARDDAYALAVMAIRTADPGIDALFAAYVRAYIEEQASTP